jgi:ribosomal protein S18 acetylase RimI-like enzyme
MSVSSAISRLASFYERNGLAATLRRAWREAWRRLFAAHMIVFYCDLDRQEQRPVKLPDSLKVERLESYADLSSADREKILAIWNTKQAHRNIRERFDRGASLWLVKSGGVLAGYSWTIRGQPIAVYYFPLAQDDVQLFDFYVFPNFRGRAILWFLISLILNSLHAEGVTRVFGDVAEWNQPSLSFYKMTPFRRLGSVRTYRIFGYKLTHWGAANCVKHQKKNTVQRDDITAVLRSNE